MLNAAPRRNDLIILVVVRSMIFDFSRRKPGPPQRYLRVVAAKAAIASNESTTPQGIRRRP